MTAGAGAGVAEVTRAPQNWQYNMPGAFVPWQREQTSGEPG
jgi:hypothetical protein